MNGLRRAFLLSTADKYFAVAIGFLTVASVSRLLTPQEIGLWVIGAAIVTLASSAREFASYNFLIQRPELGAKDIRSATTLMAIVTFVIVGALNAVAGPAAAAYGENSLAWFLRIMSLSLLLELATTPILALSRREMAFGKAAVLGATNVATNSATVIALAAAGFGYMSFAWGWLLASAVTATLAISLRRDLSIFRPSLANWREPLAFGRYYGANTLLYRANDSVLYLLLGRILPFEAVGLFSRASLMAQLPDKVLLGGIPALVVPAFSARSREGAGVKDLYLRAIEYITVVQWPALLLLVLLARPAVELVLGRQWLEIVPLVQIMAVAALFSFTAQLDYAALISVGAIRDNFRRALIVVPVAAVALIGAAFIGLMTMAMSQLVAVPLEAYVSLRFLRRHVPVGWSELARALRKSAIVAASSAAGPSAVVLAAGRFDLPMTTAALMVLLAAAGWLVGVALAQHPIRGEMRQAADALWRSHLAQRALATASRAFG